MRLRSFLLCAGLATAAAAFSSVGGCSDDPVVASQPPIDLASESVRVRITFEPFSFAVFDLTRSDADTPVLSTIDGEAEGAYGEPAATVDAWGEVPQLLPGYDGYRANEAPWRRGKPTLRDRTDQSAIIDFEASGLSLSLAIVIDGDRVHLDLEANEKEGETGALNKSTLAFTLPEDEHFFGLGERFASVDHRGLSLYSWAEEGGLSKGEGSPPAYDNPGPNGPSMTYFPVPFFLSSAGYGMYLDTTFRSELHFGSERSDAWRAAVNAPSFHAVVYVNPDPLAILDRYTEDTGRPMLPAPWVFGTRRRVGRTSAVDGVPEVERMRERDIPVTAVDDAVHFLPALSQLGIEEELMAWTSSAHDLGYKVMAYNNPYVASNDPAATEDYEYGKEHGYFIKAPDGDPALTVFISGKLLEVAAVDLTNPDAVAWYQSLLQRTLDHGYDGWMHDFGEYTARSSTFANGMNGEEGHNLFPVLSAKAAHDLLERERPDDYLFFVRSGYAGTQQYVPAVWGGDAEATFDDTQGMPSSLRAGLNLSMSGAPLWGSDMTGFKCLTNDPNDKEVFLRWVELGAVSPIMMEQNACTNPLGEPKEKWKLWNDEETIQHYIRYAGLHTRLQPYFRTLAKLAHDTGRPITLHPFLLHPDQPATWAIEDAFYLGAALYASPVVRRGAVNKDVWFPPGARYVDLDDYAVRDGGQTASVAAPLGELPLFLVSGQILPLLDPSIETLGQSDDPEIVDVMDVDDRLDVLVALEPGATAKLTLADGTVLEASRAEDADNPDDLDETDDAGVAACASCFTTSSEGDVERLRANTSEAATDAELVLEDVRLRKVGGPARRVRWDVLRLTP